MHGPSHHAACKRNTAHLKAICQLANRKIKTGAHGRNKLPGHIRAWHATTVDPGLLHGAEAATFVLEEVPGHTCVVAAGLAPHQVGLQPRQPLAHRRWRRCRGLLVFGAMRLVLLVLLVPLLARRLQQTPRGLLLGLHRTELLREEVDETRVLLRPGQRELPGAQRADRDSGPSAVARRGAAGAALPAGLHKASRGARCVLRAGGARPSLFASALWSTRLKPAPPGLLPGWGRPRRPGRLRGGAWAQEGALAAERLPRAPAGLAEPCGRGPGAGLRVLEARQREAAVAARGVLHGEHVLVAVRAEHGLQGLGLHAQDAVLLRQVRHGPPVTRSASALKLRHAAPELPQLAVQGLVLRVGPRELRIAPDVDAEVVLHAPCP
mmetsp:Transcript_86203/g.257340  ORF Transcript_86203/g.257340 Transcript_86203/m.257340 type:complete len:380 (-) Transcript_86203:995-2134(-)